jgi:hypothetical protein
VLDLKKEAVARCCGACLDSQLPKRLGQEDLLSREIQEEEEEREEQRL